MEIEQRAPVPGCDLSRLPIHVDVAVIEMDAPVVIAVGKVVEESAHVLGIVEGRHVTAVAVEAADLVVAVVEDKRFEFVAVAA